MFIIILNCRATQVSQTCQRIITYLCQYIVESSRICEMNIPSAVEIVLLRLICSFLSVGGGTILDKDLLIEVAPLLINIARKFYLGLVMICQVWSKLLLSVYFIISQIFLRKKYYTWRRSSLEKFF